MLSGPSPPGFIFPGPIPGFMLSGPILPGPNPPGAAPGFILPFGITGPGPSCPILEPIPSGIIGGGLFILKLPLLPGIVLRLPPEKACAFSKKAIEAAFAKNKRLTIDKTRIFNTIAHPSSL